MMTLENDFPDARILIVDDKVENTRFLEHLLEWAGYTNVLSIVDSKAAIELIGNYAPDIILLDLFMPEPNGFQILSELKLTLAPNEYLPVLVFTIDTTRETKTKALNAGASDFLTKPGDSLEILLRVRNFLHSRRLHVEIQKNRQHLEVEVQKRASELTTAQRGALEALARAAEFRDDNTGEHTRRVGDLSASVAAYLNQPADYIEDLRLAAPLHDVGKIALPDSILLKPGRLDDDERNLMQRHTIVGGQVLSAIDCPLMSLAREVALSHHERWDGKGYPRGLANSEIPLGARIVAVADVFDALTHERPYKEAWTEADALREITKQSGRQFDPAVTCAFAAMRRDSALT